MVTRSRVVSGVVAVLLLLLVVLFARPRHRELSTVAPLPPVATDTRIDPADISVQEGAKRAPAATPSSQTRAAGHSGHGVVLASITDPALRMLSTSPETHLAPAPEQTTVGGVASASTSPAPTPAPASFCPLGTSLRETRAAGQREKWCATEDRGGIAIKNGPYVAWFSSGRKHFEGAYRNGRQDGAWTEWYPSGVVAAKGSYRAGRREGAWTFYRETGAKAEQGPYRHGEKTGHWVVFDDAGHRAAEGEIRTSDGRLAREAGAWTYYWPNGVKKEQGTFHDGVRDGKWLAFDRHGNVVSVAQYSNGEME